MPVSQTWCDACNAYRPIDNEDDAACPECSADLSEIRAARVGDSAPWHFWLVVAALGLYLGWRLIQGVAALFG